LLTTWLNARYFTGELAQTHITEKFHQIFFRLDVIIKETNNTKNDRRDE